MYKYLFVNITWEEVLNIDTILNIGDLGCESVLVSGADKKAALKSLVDVYSDLYVLIMWNRKEYDKFREELLTLGLFMNFKKLFFIEPLISKMSVGENVWNDQILLGSAALKYVYGQMKKDCEPEQFEQNYTYLGYESLEGSKCFHSFKCRFLSGSSRRHNYYLVKKEAVKLGLRECQFCIPKKKVTASATSLEEIEKRREHERLLQEQNKNKKKLAKLMRDYNACRSKGKGANYSIKNGVVRLTIDQVEFNEISIVKACDIIERYINKIPKSDKGRGYVGNSMSVNAKLAHIKGSRPKTYYTKQILSDLGFNYSVGFFHWLIKSEYLKPVEKHHTAAAKNLTGFYNEESIKRFIEFSNLDLLNQIYKNKMTYDAAADLRGIKFAKVEIPLFLLTGKGGLDVEADCILCDGYIFVSPKLQFLRSDERLNVKDVSSLNYSNGVLEGRVEETVKLLLARKRKAYRKGLRQ